MASVDAPSWQERLAACFRVRHRLLHVVGVPLALGGIAAAAASGSPHARALALGVIVTVIGSLLAAWYVVLGGDHRLVARLEGEKREARERSELAALATTGSPERRALLDGIRTKLDGIEQALELALEHAAGRASAARLDGVCDDLALMRRKVVAIASELLANPAAEARSDAVRLEAEITSLARELKESTGALRDALVASEASAEAELTRRRAAIDLDARATSRLEGIAAELEAVAKIFAARVMLDDAAERDVRARLATMLAACDPAPSPVR